MTGKWLEEIMCALESVKAVRIYESDDKIIIGKVFIRAWHRYKVVFFVDGMPPKRGIYYVGYRRNERGQWEPDEEMSGLIPDIEAELKKKDEYIWQKALRKLWTDPAFQLMKEILLV